MKPNAITQCQTKRAYSSKEEAEDTATYLYYEKNVDVEPYKCSMCEQFHLTGNNKE